VTFSVRNGLDPVLAAEVLTQRQLHLGLQSETLRAIGLALVVLFCSMAVQPVFTLYRVSREEGKVLGRAMGGEVHELGEQDSEDEDRQRVLRDKLDRSNRRAERRDRRRRKQEEEGRVSEDSGNRLT